MTDIFLTISGNLFESVPVDLNMQIYGAPFSFRLSTQGPISLLQAWNAISQKLQEHLGISLPDLSGGPWGDVLGRNVYPTVYIGPAPTGSNGATPTTSVYLELQLEDPISIGGTREYGPFTITLEPDVTIYSVLLGYENGLDIRLRISTPTTTGTSTTGAATLDGPPKYQIVSYPFPLPPQKSTASKAFEFKYLGLGQKVGPDPITNSDDPLNAIFEQLESQFTATDPATILRELATKFYHPDRNWFIGAHVVIVGWDIKVLFNDPAMYGLRISVPMEPPSPFMGLLFEILYQKLGPNLGVYYGAITLPYFMRRIVLEAAILVLPGFSIWVYTNGDFRINVGWPLGDSSIGIQVGGILCGIAGFYFAKLSSGDNPGAQPSVDYNPILLFGIGLSVYVRQGYSAGIFSASIDVSITATLQGLLAWKAGQGALGPPDHYWFAGVAGVSALIQGSVDFSILKASVVISLQASVGIAFETGYQTYIPISARVSVSVSVRVVFISISLSFSASVSVSFTIGSGSQRASLNGPLDPDLSGFVLPSTPSRQLAARSLAVRFMEHVAAWREPEAVRRQGRAALRAAAPQLIDIYFMLQPTAVYGDQPSIEVVASLVMEASSGSPSGTSFEQLVHALVTWLVDNYSSPGLPWPERLSQVATELGSGSEPPGPAFGGTVGFGLAIDSFLQTSISFQIHGVDGSGAAPLAGPAAVLPMLDTLQLTYVAEGSPSPITIDFSTYNLIPYTYPEAVAIYFEELSWSNTGSSADGSSADGSSNLLTAAEDDKQFSMAAYLLHDYFLLLARRVVGDLAEKAPSIRSAAEQLYFERYEACGDRQEAVLDCVAEYVATISSDAGLERFLSEADYSGAAGMGSRYLLHGLQLPRPDRIPPNPTPGTMRLVPTEGLYVLTGQQFPAIPGATSVSATLSFGNSARAGYRFAAESGATSRIDIPSSVPPPPSAQWTLQQTLAATLTPSRITVSPLPPLNPQPLYYTLRNQIAWTAGHADRTLLSLPEPLVAALRATGLFLEVTGSEPAEHFQSAMTGSPGPGVIGSAPALLIRLSLSQVPANSANPAGSAGPSTASPSIASPRYLPNVYQLGGTDQQTRDLILDALSMDLSEASITLLYANSANVLVSEPLSATTLVAKTNLSSLNQVADAAPRLLLRAAALAADAQPEFAPVTEVKNFLRLIWELSVVNAPGYYLFYESASGQDLPADLFATQGVGGNSSPFQILVSFSQPGQQAPLSKVQNCVWIDQATPPNTALYGAVLDANRQPLRQYSPTCPPGSLAFGIDWSDPPASAHAPRAETSPDEIPIDEIYQLIQYAVLSAGGYSGSSWSLPAGPAQSQPNPLLGLVRSGTDWQYTVSLPISRFFGPASPQDHDPYSMVGSPVTVAFRLDDLYGNALPGSHALTSLPLYTDPVIGIGEWPGVQVHYHFEPLGSQAATLMLSVLFDPAALTPQIFSPAPSEASAARQWNAVLSRYDLIRCQLADPNYSVAVDCSLGGGPVGDPNQILADLQSFVAQVEQQILLAMSADSAFDFVPAEPEIVRLAIPIPIAFSAVRALPNDVVQIGVRMAFARDPQFVAPEVAANLPSVVAVSYTPNPDLQLGAGSPAGGGMAAFAALFEASFAKFDGASGLLKLAETSGIRTSSNAGDTAPLWAVRWSALSGISVAFDPQRIVYFALRPLSTSLVSRLSPSTGQLYSGVDLDQWAYEFLLAVDSFLAPRNAVAIAILDVLNLTGHFNHLMAAKDSLASSIPQGMARLLVHQETQGNLDEARERLRQSLLSSLGTAYTVSTVVQAEAGVSASAPLHSPASQPPTLFGSLGPLPSGSPAAEARQYTLTNAELELHPGPNRMTVLVSVANPTAQSQLDLPLWYQVSYLQHDFGEEQSGYVPSSWIKFILPGASPLVVPVTGSAAAEIPIPLPFYPASPILRSQSAAGVDLTSPPVSASPNTVENEIADLLRWQYAVEVSHQWAAQDQLYLDATFNKPIAPSRLLRFDPKSALFDALAWFRQQYASIAAELPVIAQEAYPGTTTGSPGRAAEVIAIFREAMERVADAWKFYWSPTFAEQNESAGESILDHFYLQKSGPDGLQLYGRTDDGLNPEYWPAITSQATGETWIPDRSRAIPPALLGGFWSFTPVALGQNLDNLRLTWQPLDVLERQTAILSSWVVRNASLTRNGEPVNPDFIFQTSAVEFPNPLVPLIQRDAIPVLQPDVSLAATLAGILTPMARLGASMHPWLRIGASYEFTIAAPPNGGAPLSSSIAILLADGVQLTGGGSVDSAARSIAEQLADWYIRIQPSTRNALLVFSISVFGATGDQELPLVRIGRVPVAIDPDFSWWTGGAS